MYYVYRKVSKPEIVSDMVLFNFNSFVSFKSYFSFNEIEPFCFVLLQSEIKFVDYFSYKFN